MSDNAVQPIETSHYTYDAHKASNNKQDPTHQASKIHPVGNPIEHPHTTTTALVAAPTEHSHATTERPHAVAEHAQPALVQHPAHPAAPGVAEKKQQQQHAQTTAATESHHPQTATTPAPTHPHVAFDHPEHPVVVAVPSNPHSHSHPTVDHTEDKHAREEGLHTDTTKPHHHHHNRSHPAQNSEEIEAEQPPHKHTYSSTPHSAHPSSSTSSSHPHQVVNTNANDAMIPSDSILSESPLSNSSSFGATERRQSWSKDEMKRGVMEGLLEGEGRKKGAKGGYSSTSPI